MNKQPLDNIFKQRLSEGAMPVPGGLWESIEPHLPEARKRNRWGLIWIIGAGVLIIAGSILLLRYFGESSEDQQAISETLTSSDTQKNANANNVIENTNPNSELASEPVVNQMERSYPDADTRISQGADQKNTKASRFRTTTTSVDQTPASKQGATTGVAVNLLSGEDTYVQDQLMSSQSGITLTQEASRPEEKSNYNSLRLSNTFLLLATEMPRALPDPAKDCYSFGRKGSGGKQGVLFGEAYIGPTFSSRKLTSRAEDVSSYITARDSTESSRLSWHGGLRLGYLHRSGLTLRIGGHYTVVNELFDYFDGSSTGTVIRMDTIRDAGGNIISIDIDTIVVSGRRIKRTHNRYHTIDIPVLVGYQFMQNNWTYGIQAGPVFNAAFVKKGDILDPAGVPVTITDNDDAEYPAYKDKLGLSLYVAAHIAKRIGYRTYVYAEPYLQRRLQGLTLDTYPIEQRQTNVGLSLGVRVILQ